jgi:uncharacterized phage protein (TIGR02218 family)
MATFVAATPYLPVRIDVIRVYDAVATDITYKIIFSGIIVSIHVDGIAASVTCVSDGNSLEKQIPRIAYQSFCNHSVFDTGCNLSSAEWKYDTTVFSIESSGTELVLSNIEPGEDDFYTAGVICFDLGYRLITRQLGNTIKILTGFYGLAVDSKVYLLPGCNGSPETCDGKFGNLLRFLGFPYMPVKNPVLWGFR